MREADAKKYGSDLKGKWMVAMAEALKALEENGYR